MQEVDVKAVVSKLLLDVFSFRDLLGTGVRLHQTVTLKKLPGVYLVAATGYRFSLNSLDQVVYVGMSSNIRARWANHHKMPTLEKMEQIINSLPCLGNDQESEAHPIKIYPWYFPLATTEQLVEVEAELIQVIRPLFNQQTPLATVKALPVLLPEKESV